MPTDFAALRTASRTIAAVLAATLPEDRVTPDVRNHAEAMAVAMISDLHEWAEKHGRRVMQRRETVGV